jgi:hypothetical protein
MNTAGQNALASVSNQGYRPRLIEFHGYEGEDFRHFLKILESFLAISNTHNDSRKLVILKSQLRRAAKIYYENIILKENTELTYDMAIEKLKEHYITPELIQSYELGFNEMYQGDQEHPQIFLARLREAADLANITSEEVVQSRFRAGLLREIKQFCIQCSSKTFQDWINHAEGWWNANRPRKIAMVDNPFIPRNINNALIYHDDNAYHSHHNINNHNIELIDTEERPTQFITINDVRSHHKTRQPYIVPNQLSTMDIIGQPNDSKYYAYHTTSNNHNNPLQTNNQQDLFGMIQQAIRNELSGQGCHSSQNRFNNRNNRNNYRNNDGNNGYNNGRYNNSNGYNSNGGYNNIGYNNGYNNFNNRNSYNSSGHNQSRNNGDYNNRSEYNRKESNSNYNNQPFTHQHVQQQSQQAKN